MKQEYVPPVASLLAAIAVLAAASHYPAQARAFPDAVAWLLTILATLDLLSVNGTSAGNRIRGLLNPSVAALEGEAQAATQVRAILWLALFTVMLVLIGILYAVPLYMLASMRLRGNRSWLISLAVAGATTAFIWFLFAGILRLELYPGYLFGGDI
jgi:hypothetical protein